MKTAICVVAVLACAALASGESISNRPGHLYEMRERLGHFKDQPYIDLYKHYVAAFVLPQHPERSADDDRNYSPHAQECVLFLNEYRQNKYQIRRIEQFVILDACLGYLYQSEHHELDEERGKELVQANLQRLKDDPSLSEFFQSTKIDDIPEEAKHCVADLLLSSVLMRRQFGHEQCNNDWIQLFLQFAECHKTIPQELREDDSYVKTLYQAVRDETHRCFDNEIHFLNAAVRKTYKRAVFTRISNKLSGKFNTMQRQQGQRMWPASIVNLLKTIQGANKEVSLRQVHQLLRGYYLDDPKLKQIFLDNVANYATKVISPKARDGNGDPTGEERYKDLVVNGLCNFFRTADRKNHLDFSTSFVRLVELLKHEDVFELSFKAFIERILTHSHETASLYLSISACNILTFTEGRVVLPQGNGKITYVVEPVADTTQMVRWPDAGFY